MANWQQIIKDRHPASKILNETQVLISHATWTPATKQSYDNIITRDTEQNYFIITEYKHNTNELTGSEIEHDLYNYLGY